MHKSITAVIAILLGISGISTASAKSACATSEEVTALNARVLQSDLMVAALSCKQQPSYNAFVKKYQSDLIRRSGAVQGYFKRVYGKSGEYQLNKFITNIANESSTTSLNMSESIFCAAAQQVFDEVLESGKRDLSAALETSKFNHRHGVESCKSVAAN